MIGLKKQLSLIRFLLRHVWWENEPSIAKKLQMNQMNSALSDFSALDCCFGCRAGRIDILIPCLRVPWFYKYFKPKQFWIINPEILILKESLFIFHHLCKISVIELLSMMMWQIWQIGWKYHIMNIHIIIINHQQRDLHYLARSWTY